MEGKTKVGGMGEKEAYNAEGRKKNERRKARSGKIKGENTKREKGGEDAENEEINLNGERQTVGNEEGEKEEKETKR